MDPARRHHRSILLAGLMAIFVVGACSSGATSSPSPSPRSSPSAGPSVEPSPEPSASLEPSPSPTPCPDLPPGGPIASDHLTTIELEETATGDVLAFGFGATTPGSAPTVRLEVVTPPFVQDPSGLPLEIEGEHFLRIRFDGMWLYDDAGVPTRGTDEPIVGSPPAIVAVARESEYEGVSSWIVGLVGTGCIVWREMAGGAVLALEVGT